MEATVFYIACNQFYPRRRVCGTCFASGEQAQVKDASESEYGFQVTSTKESLAAFVNSYLNDKASNKLDYKVEIDDDVHVAGKIKAFSTSIDAFIAFEPTVKKTVM